MPGANALYVTYISMMPRSMPFPCARAGVILTIVDPEVAAAHSRHVRLSLNTTYRGGYAA